ncbi:Glycoside hydrolase, superfamily domain-containing protein [Rozella allomycis CSF55]|uniref:Glycoside hydrolase, superfamily domain-containing protein n=1 Tax=Rozella allomycis (strain CSF55) TaxID=988480 RepID=A0A075ATQ5_ROZAC|nr:Glycoside hydrolase, superfamily domain-containing protein [Rozella allomycis CSF55]|eukprot:EPZ33623.1 Glycoside hydrolase, superfamily domain-containing protein [Rozella allomycis CSF55]
MDDNSLNINGRWFTDRHGRVLMLRGVNLSGNCKLPYSPYIPSHVKDGFFDHRNVSFVGRPFPLEEADEHFERLAHWGMYFIRFCVTWEAIEHKGPGIYDFEYIEYIVQILKKAKAHGIKVFIDPHQDVWSRFSGGSGAPGWTLEKCGFVLENLVESEAAIVHNLYANPADYPKMIWPSNYYKLASCTMFTLFFAGKTFAPNMFIDNVQVQEYLQSHYINSILQLVSAIVRHELNDTVVVGYDTFNEPSHGYIGIEDITKFAYNHDLRLGNTPTPFEGMILGEGNSISIENWKFTRIGFRFDKSVIANKGNVRAWNNESECIWAKHGVWDRQTLKILKKDYFFQDPVTRLKVDFHEDFWKPFALKYVNEIRKVHNKAIIFIEPAVNESPPRWSINDPHDRIVYAPHWYDGYTLIRKAFSAFLTVDFIGYKNGRYPTLLHSFSFGLPGIKGNFSRQLAHILKEGTDLIGQHPCLIGEMGIPYDMDQKRSFLSHDYSNQISALDSCLHAIENNLLNCTIWNYTSDNNNMWGDQWNGEDLSIYNNEVRLEENELNSSLITKFKGGRALEAAIRPYPLKINGIPKILSFNCHNGDFIFEFTSMSGNDALPTEIFLPKYHYRNPEEVNIQVSDGMFKLDLEAQRLSYYHDSNVQRHTVKITKRRKTFSFCTML